jgi:hypothetical protein
MDKLSLVCWVLAGCFFGIAAFWASLPPDDSRRGRLIAAGLLCIAIAQVFALGPKAFN